MKLTEEALKMLIKEVLKENEQNAAVNPEVDAKMKTGVMSTQQRIKQSRERIKSAGKELETNEQKIIDQLEAKITQLASLPGVDLTRHRPLLMRVLKLLIGTITPKETK